MTSRATALVWSVMAAVGRGTSRLFRNNTGDGWQGNWVKLANGDVLIKNPRYIKFGLCEGSSDTIGWHSVVITPEMVGMLIAIFVALECKSGKGRATAEQNRFIAAVVAAGGIGAVVRSAEEAERALEKWALSKGA